MANRFVVKPSPSQSLLSSFSTAGVQNIPELAPLKAIVHKNISENKTVPMVFTAKTKTKGVVSALPSLKITIQQNT